MQEVFAALVRAHVAPALKADGFRKRGRTTWYDVRPNGGWVLLTLRGDRWNSAEEAQFWGEGTCWPAGTWRLRQDVLDPDGDDRDPIVDPSAPLSPDSRLDRPTPPALSAWVLRDGTDPDQVAAEVVAWLRATAADLRAAADDLDLLVDRLLGRPPRVWTLAYAVAAIQALADGRHPRLAEAVAAVEARWTADPRPLALGPVIQQWSRRDGPEETGQSRHGNGIEP